MPRRSRNERLPFNPMDLVLRYSLEQRATDLDDPIEAAVQHWQIEVVAEQFEGDGDEPVSSPIGWARVTIVARHQAPASMRPSMQLMETTRQWRRPSSIRQVVISQRI